MLSTSVHIVHGVHVRGRLDRAELAFLLEAVDDVAHQGFGEVELVGNLPVGLALLVERADIEVAGVDVFFRALLKVLPLRTGVQEAEVDEGVVVDYLAGDDVLRAVFKLAVADLDLLDVAEVLVFGGLADGEDAVEEIEQAGAAGQVVSRDGAAESALGRVGDDQEVPVVLYLDVSFTIFCTINSPASPPSVS